MKVLKDTILGGLSFLGLPSDRAVVLMYHSVSPGADDYFTNVEPAAFERQMEYLARTKRSVLPLAELMRRFQAGEALGGSVAITFDDGYRDNFETAFPILREYGFPATIFVATDHIGHTDKRGLQRLTEAQLLAMEASGLITIEPHTRSHPHLSKLAEAQVREEIIGAKEILERLLGKTCRFFAYPYGDSNAVTAAIVRESGFQAAFSVREGTMRPGQDPFALPRVSIDSSTSLAQFRGKVSHGVDIYERLKRGI